MSLMLNLFNLFCNSESLSDLLTLKALIYPSVASAPSAKIGIVLVSYQVDFCINGALLAKRLPKTDERIRIVLLSPILVYNVRR